MNIQNANYLLHLARSKHTVVRLKVIYLSKSGGVHNSEQMHKGLHMSSYVVAVNSSWSLF